jgi:hypothetical protein
LGLRALHPTFFHAFAAQLADEMRSRGRRAAYAFVQIPRIRITEKYAKASPEDANQDFLFSITRWPRLAAQVGFDLPLLVSVGIKKMFFPNGYISPLPAWLTALSIRARMGVNVGYADYFRLWKENKFMEYPAWSLERKGLYGFNASAHPEDYARAVERAADPKSVVWAVNYFHKCCDLLGEHFDPKLVQEMADGLKALSEVTDHVIIYDMHEAETFERLREPGADQRIADLMRTLTQGTGAEFYDIAKGMAADPANFSDFHHPSRQGVRLLTSRMAQAILATNAKHP